MLFGVTYCNLMKYKHGTCVATVLSGLLFNSFTQLSKTVIVVMATAPLLLGVVALFLWEKIDEMEFDAESISNHTICNKCIQCEG
ncbi:hypothetical protein ACOMICROBIO_EPCKBFOG_03556 [Vibrio sp. B1FLJ16]|nr:hypothetical protein ACOMICROBIO_EPCKBFOG_03556 [Vibrio sp. B1FLJ16]CAE6937759.1 hypothetical protein ACOMICROBIO_EPCKBFOG_03556 [Vibrio sp. B1FLJ16]